MQLWGQSSDWQGCCAWHAGRRDAVCRGLFGGTTMTSVVDTSTPANWLRSAIMVIGGVLGLFWSEGALATLAIIGGAIMVIDGGLGLWRLAFGERSGQFWPAVVRSALAVLAGLL